MNLKTSAKILVVLLISWVPLYAGVSTVVNLCFSGPLLIGAVIAAKQTKQKFDAMPDKQVANDMQKFFNQSTLLIRDIASSNKTRIEQDFASIKKTGSRIKDNAGPATGWATITLLCGVIGIKLLLAGLAN